MVEIGFATRNGRLWAHYRESRPSATTRAAVLFLHGWRSDAESGYGDLPDRLAEQGFPTLAVDLPGHGKSQGDLDTLTYQELIEAAADSAAELLRRSGRDRLALVGSSVGGFLAARLTASLPVTALALWVPTDFADDLVDHDQPFASTALTESALAWRSAPHAPADSGALRALSRFRGRALVIEAADDELVPHQTTQNYLTALSASAQVDHLILGDARHRLSTQPRAHSFASAVTEGWFTARAEPSADDPAAAADARRPAPAVQANAFAASARMHVRDLEAALPLYERLAGEHAHRFSYRDMQLAKAGPFLLIQGADAAIRSHAATVSVHDIAATASAIEEAGGELLEGPAPGPNGPRLIARHPDGNTVEYIQVG